LAGRQHQQAADVRRDLVGKAWLSHLRQVGPVEFKKHAWWDPFASRLAIDRTRRDQNVAIGKECRWSVGGHQLLRLVRNGA
jgi:hypothetical protein